MTPDGWTADAWQKQMHAEVKVAYRLVELGLVGDPDSIPYDPEEIARIDAEYDVWKAEVERAAAARALEEVANDLRVSFSRGAAIAMHHQCHKKQCRCGNPGNDEIVRAVFDAAREELRARAEAYRQEREEQ